MTLVVPATQGAIARAAGLIVSGRVVAFPTETVYGLGADAGNDDAVGLIYALKRRPAGNPLIVHCASIDHAFSIAEPTGVARRLASEFWPGPLTMVLTVRPDGPVCCRARSGAGTIALRVPSHPVALSLIEHSGVAIVAPSANPSGRVSPTTAAHVADDFGGGEPSLILDGGSSSGGVESSIVDARFDRVSLLRPGGIPRERIEALTGCKASRNGSPVVVPGRFFRHYAPSVPLFLNVGLPPPAGHSYLGFGLPSEYRDCGSDILDLSASRDFGQAASRLFAMLRRLERLGRPISVASIPSVGLGEAINDRLERAAGEKK